MRRTPEDVESHDASCASGDPHLQRTRAYRAAHIAGMRRAAGCLYSSCG